MTTHNDDATSGISTGQQATKLEAGTMSLRSVIFQNMTNMAPAAAIVYDFPLQIAAAGAALWIANGVSMFAVLLVASSIVQFARKMPSAGGYYTYLSRSLGSTAGAFSGWIYFLYALILPAEVTIIWAGIASSLTEQYLNLKVHWSIFEIVMLGVVVLLAYTGVKRSLRVTLIAGALEIAIFIALGIALFAKPNSAIDFGALVPSASPTGWTGILGFGVVFGILNFVGFESAAPMAEETDNPRRNIPLAIMISVTILGSLYLVLSFATVFGWGVPDLANFVSDPAPFDTLANRVFGIGGLIIFFAITNSSLACALATVNQGSRVLMSMGRNGLVSSQLAEVHPTHRTPAKAVALIGGVTLLIALVSGFKYGTVTAFGITATTLTVGAMVVYALGNIGVIRYFTTTAKADFNVLYHLIMPVTAVGLLGYVLYKCVLPMPAYPFNLPLFIAGVWMVIGLVLIAWARKSRAEGFAAVMKEEIG